MPVVFTLNGFRWACALMANDLRGATLCLFSNDVVPTPAFLLSDFVQPAFPGYAPFAFEAWPGVFLNSVPNAESDYPFVRFTVETSGPVVMIYGYFVVSKTGYVLFAERDPGAPVPLQYAGDFYTIAPRIQAGFLCAEYPAANNFVGGVSFGGLLS